MSHTTDRRCANGDVSAADLRVTLRRMRTKLLLLCACCALLVPAGAASAARSHSRRAAAPCTAKGSKTVALNPLARVYVRSERGDADQHLLIGCLLHSGQTVELASWFDCGCSRGDEPAPQVWLRERIVALNRWGCSPDPTSPFDCTGSARTVSLRTGETLRSANTGTSVAALVQGPRGSFAYVSAGGAVLKSDADGEGVLLDAGPGVASDSLAAAGVHVYWMHGAVPFAASLRP